MLACKIWKGTGFKRWHHVAPHQSTPPPVFYWQAERRAAEAKAREAEAEANASASAVAWWLDGGLYFLSLVQKDNPWAGISYSPASVMNGMMLSILK